jgi:uncharacterized phosphosugar-binding protein
MSGPTRSAAAAYMQAVRERLDSIAAAEMETVLRCAEIIAEAIQRGGMLYLFGTGHSHMLAEEGHFRAGGLAAVCPVLASGLMLHESADVSGLLERTPGVASSILTRYQPKAGDVMMIFSNSGINMAPVEMAQRAKALGLTVIAVVCLAYADSLPTGPAGVKLTEAADLTLDNHGVPGDALIAVGEGLRAGPLSTIAGAFLLNAILVEAAARLQARGITPPVIVSINMPGAAEHNAELVTRYGPRNPHL